ncbi:MAG TPA: hypothetical protein VMT42_01180 [candidate division Zixibacteria bacterium]|nr:hypothetical protein [candidate division Zixibacteria bacterium]
MSRFVQSGFSFNTGFGMTNPQVTTKLTEGIFTTAFSMQLQIDWSRPVLILLLIHVLIGI